MTIRTFIFLLSIYTSVLGQNNVGYFDYKKVASSIEINERILELNFDYKKNIEDSLNIMTKNLENYYKQNLLRDIPADSTVVNKINKDIHNLISAIENYQAQAQIRSIKHEDLIKYEIRKEILLMVRDFCIQKNITCIGDKESVVFCTECVDYTDELIKYLYSRRKK